MAGRRTHPLRAALALAWAFGSVGCVINECDSDRDCPEDHLCVELTLVTRCLPPIDDADLGGVPCEAGFVELCNRLDDDCDGRTDEVPGRGFSCYPAGPETLGVGVCRAGRSTVCVDGVLGICEGAVLPSDEQCNGLDDDCDGRTDEPPPDGFPCYPYGEGLDDLTVGQGVCRSGTAACVGGVLGDCLGAVVPGEEQCNGLDDDCDGVVGRDGSDDGLQRACETVAECPDVTAGAQAADDARCCFGVQGCVVDDQGVWDWTPCVGGNAQSQRVGEVCNGTDDDCDGVADEGTEEADPPTENPALAQQMAQVGFDCVSLGLPGEVEGADAPTLGACRRFGRLACDPAVSEVRCTAAAAAPGAERCDETPLPDGLYMPEMDRPRVPNFPEDARIEHRDEDCDGTVDELEDGSIEIVGTFAAETLRVGEACTAGTGGCAGMGALVCGASGDTASCDAVATPPDEETCNGTDDDCDGRIDEAVDANGMEMPLTRPCGTDWGICRAGVETCAMGAFGGCTAVESATPDVEWCDGLNNDCDGPPGPGDPMSESDGLTDETCSCVGVEGAAIPAILPGFSDVRTAPMDADRANALRGTCGGGEARDIALAFTAPSAGLWRFRARGRERNMRDPVVYVTSVCASASIEPGVRDDMDEKACADDDGAVVDPDVGLEPAGQLGASAVTRVDNAGAELTVVVDGFGPGDEGQWRLDTRRIDVGPDERRKHVMLEGPSGARVLQPSSRCRRRRVNLNKPDGPATLDDKLPVFCADNDGIYRALQLDGDGMDPVDGALRPGQVARVQGRLLPRVVDEADWFSVKLAGAGAERSVDLTLWPPDDLIAGLAEGDGRTFAEDRRRCLGEWTRLVAYVACTDGAPANVGGGRCVRDEPTQHLLCTGDEWACVGAPPFEDAGRSMALSFAADSCPAEGAKIVLFVGVLRQPEQSEDCFCNFGDETQNPTPDRSVTYELNIDYR